jgi:hypothetical protein
MKKFIVILLSISVFSQIGFSQNQQNAHERIRASKAAFITDQLQLSPEEAQSFWPVYNKFENKFRELRDELRPQRRKELNEEESADLIVSFLLIQQEELDLQKQMYSELEGIISASQMVKLHFAEKKFKQKLLERMNKQRDKKRS